MYFRIHSIFGCRYGLQGYMILEIQETNSRTMMVRLMVNQIS